MEKTKQCKGLSITSLVLGIIGIVLSIFLVGGVIGFLGGVFGLIGIIKSKSKNRMAIAGFILSVIAIVITSFTVYVITRDTSFPTIEQIGTEVYIGEEIDLTKLVKVTDLNWLGENNDANVKLTHDPIDITQEGSKKIKVFATDNRNNKTEKEIEIQIVNPVISVYDYIKKNISKKGYYNYTIENYSNNEFSIKHTTKDSKDYGIINFTKKNIKDYSEFSGFQFIDIIKFNNNLEVTEIHRTSTLLGRVTNEDLELNSDTAKSTIDVVNDFFEDILGKNRNVNIAGKTVEQLKKETIDLRELK